MPVMLWHGSRKIGRPKFRWEEEFSKTSGLWTLRTGGIWL
jgi:hypothetical protein